MTDYPDGLYFMALGGTGEIGENFYLYCADGQWLIVDCGVRFGDETTPGIDVILPDPSFIYLGKQHRMVFGSRGGIGHGRSRQTGSTGEVQNKNVLRMQNDFNHNSLPDCRITGRFGVFGGFCSAFEVQSPPAAAVRPLLWGLTNA